MLFGGKKDSASTATNKNGLLGSMTIAWDDQFKTGNIMWKVPRNIQFNDNIVVREDEIAAFFRDGKVLAYLDQPGRFALTSLNAPLVGKLFREVAGVRQQAEVYYIQKRILDGKYGSKEPYPFRDTTFGVVNLRVFGEYRYRVSNAENFINQFVGTFNLEKSTDVEDRLKDQMVILLYDVIGKLKDNGMSVLDLPSTLTTIEQMVLAESKEHFDQFGIGIDKLSGLYVSMPEEVQKAVDERSSMQVLGVNYMQYQAGKALVDAAKNPSSGTASVGVGIGAGMGMGYMMTGMMNPQMAAAAQQPQAAVPGSMPGSPCSKCGTMIPQGYKFCPNCGAPVNLPPPVQQHACVKCNAQIPSGTRFCPSCGAPQQ
ncbi:MAG: SPFH domain-containing protein [Candidatus Thermoplasmatota archaeon]|nr:SPFH domain-containing protein [Candidatus Thermoplasmatota archaeon]MCL5963459.1 SPFH domain-containing protein [Candidatus Thermoplasmatota archaeon]